MSISYEQFAQVEIKIGTILTVEVIPEADKLLRLTVDLAEGEPRQIVSGIRAYFENPQELVGKQCPFITNLEPRTIRGVVSNGMILAASSDGALALLYPSTPVPPGTTLK